MLPYHPLPLVLLSPPLSTPSPFAYPLSWLPRHHGCYKNFYLYSFLPTLWWFFPLPTPFLSVINAPFQKHSFLCVAALSPPTTPPRADRCFSYYTNYFKNLSPPPRKRAQSVDFKFCGFTINIDNAGKYPIPITSGFPSNYSYQVHFSELLIMPNKKIFLSVLNISNTVLLLPIRCVFLNKKREKRLICFLINLYFFGGTFTLLVGKHRTTINGWVFGFFRKIIFDYKQAPKL